MLRRAIHVKQLLSRPSALEQARHFAAAAGKVHHLSAEDDLRELVADAKVNVLYFSAAWCGPCRVLAPFMDELAAKLDSASFVKVDIDDHDIVAVDYGVQAVPSVFVISDGDLQAKVVGAGPQQQAEIEEAVSAALDK